MDLGGFPREPACPPLANIGDEDSKDSIRAAILVGGAVSAGGGGAEKIDICSSLRSPAANRSWSVQALASIICSLPPDVQRRRIDALLSASEGILSSQGFGEMHRRCREDSVDSGCNLCGALIWL